MRKKSEKVIVYEAEPLTLFFLEQEKSETLIRISSKQTAFKRQVNFQQHKGNTISRHVRFILCGEDLSDSFEALNMCLALVKVFEHRQYGTGTKQMGMQLSSQDNLFFKSETVKYKESYDGLRIGWIRLWSRNETFGLHTMHIGQVHAFRNALHRALSWLSPRTQVEYVELVDKDDITTHNRSKPAYW